jgi:hypothetical protein
VTDSDKVYRLIKQYSGSKHATVNKKYDIPYEAQNNMNIIILSNSVIPLYVARDEKPTSEQNNQFFVFDFKPFQGKMDPDMDQKLEDRIGHYVRTELKTVFSGLNFSGNRYSIKTPITPEEAGLFESNMTEEESVVEKVIDDILEEMTTPSSEFKKFLEEGYFPSSILEGRISATKLGTHRVIKNLKEQGYLTMENSQKKMIGKRLSCYRMTDKLMQVIKEGQVDEVDPK